MQTNLQQTEEATIAAIIPCHNEEHTIGLVVKEIAKNLPKARIYVFDNCSTDDTAAVSKEAGAIVYACKELGKGNTAHRMFNDIDADIYFMVDGDDTYSLDNLASHIKEFQENNLDMLVGKRNCINRQFHDFGNKFFNQLFNLCFFTNFSDIFSGYRILSKRFIKSLPIESKGFEIEAELNLHCSIVRGNYAEKSIGYKDRSDISKSKLSTIKDGIKILFFIIKSLFVFRPALVFASLFLIESLRRNWLLCGVIFWLFAFLTPVSRLLKESRRLAYTRGK